MNQSICSQCSRINRAGAKFCTGCGGTLHTQPQSHSTGWHSQPVGLGTGRLPAQSFLNNRYLIIKKIGQGGMGAVYQVTDTHINQVMAVKEMSNSAIDPPDRPYAIAQFEQEARLLQRLQHPNIPTVSDKFSINDRHFLVMDYRNGRTLQQMIDAGESPFSEEQVSEWAEQLCDVLAYLHNQNPPIIFRDIKPDNIMIDADGKVKLIDFGIVRHFTKGKKKDTMALGTLGYAPPEEHGSGQTDARSDVYSLGATLFCLLTGKDPGLYPLPPIRQISPAISPQMESVVVQATKVSASSRFANMEAFRKSLPVTQRFRRATQTAVPINRTIQNRGGQLKSSTRPKVQTSRLTTNLLLAASDFSTGQLAAGGGGLLLLILIAAWFATPLISGTWFWHNVPTIAIVAPFAYAATRRRGVAAVAHIAVAVVGAVLTWYRANLVGDYVELFIGAFISAALIEGMIALLPRIMGSLNRDDPGAWQREMAWLGAVAVVGHIVLAGIATSLTFALNPIAWLFAFALGSLGWFLGDMIQGYIYLKQVGMKWR